MNPWRWVDPRVGDVRLDAVRRYLESRGWREKQGAQPELGCYQSVLGGNGTDRISWMIPVSEQAADYALSLTYFLTTLSEIEDRHPVLILEEMLEAQTADTVRSAAVGS